MSFKKLPVIGILLLAGCAGSKTGSSNLNSAADETAAYKRDVFLEQLRCKILSPGDGFSQKTISIHVSNNGLEEFIFSRTGSVIGETKAMLQETRVLKADTGESEDDPRLTSATTYSNAILTGTRFGINKAKLENMSLSMDIDLGNDLTAKAKTMKGKLKVTNKVVTGDGNNSPKEYDLQCDVVGYFAG